MALSELFPRENHRFHLTLRRADLREFFAPSAAAAVVLPQRRQWLAADPARYARTQPEGVPLVQEWAEQLRQWGLADGADCATLGGEVEPDFLLLARDAEGVFRLRAGALVFPTSWALEEKIGRTMEEIHGVVPGLNASIGAAIAQFMNKLKPGQALLRGNWGFAATDALNLHPAQPRPALEPHLAPEQVWLRVEHQILATLPRTAGIVFGLRIALHPLPEILGDESVRQGLSQALATMPVELARYKGLDAIRERLLQWLGPLAG